MARTTASTDREVSDRIVAYALYTDPPLGRAGLSETEARKTRRPLLIGQRPMSLVSRAIEKGETGEKGEKGEPAGHRPRSSGASGSIRRSPSSYRPCSES